MRLIVGQGRGSPFSLLVVYCGCLGHLCFGNPDLWDRGLVTVLGSFFCGLVTPTNPSPGHRFAPESHLLLCNLLLCITNIYMTYGRTKQATRFARHTKGFPNPKQLNDLDACRNVECPISAGMSWILFASLYVMPKGPWPLRSSSSAMAKPCTMWQKSGPCALAALP